jgi:hypothetical protein
MHQLIDNLATHGCKEGFRVQPQRPLLQVNRDHTPGEVARASIKLYQLRFSASWTKANCSS